MAWVVSFSPLPASWSLGNSFRYRANLAATSTPRYLLPAWSATSDGVVMRIRPSPCLESTVRMVGAVRLGRRFDARRGGNHVAPKPIDERHEPVLANHPARRGIEDRRHLQHRQHEVLVQNGVVVLR